MNKKERMLKIAKLFKISEDHGVLQNISNVTNYSTRESFLDKKDLKVPDLNNLYPNTDDDKKDTKLTPNLSPRSLSTRYSPDRVGVQARRVDDDSVADPFTGKIYRRSEGYELENGTVIPGGSISLQTKI
jgi:hypothetical protein